MKVQQKAKTTLKYPKAYLITFTTHGTWLHGEDKGSVDKNNNKHGFPFVPANPELKDWELNQSDKIITFNKEEREAVLASIISTCKSANWNLLTAHIRSNHLHAVIKAECSPDVIMKSLKGSATINLKENFSRFKDSRIWTSNGSKKYLWDADSIKRAMRYTLHEQGEPMAVFPR